MAGRLSKSGGAGRLGGGVAADLSTSEGLASYGRSVGLAPQVDEIADETPRLSFLQRLSRGLSALNPAEAILTGVENKSALAGAKEYVVGAAKDVASAVTGNDYGGEKRYFADVAEELGVENGIARFGIGFVGDVLLDPSTYFGGAIARGAVKGTSAVASKALSGVGKVAPEVETGLRMAGKGVKDAAGRAFQFGYGASKGAREEVLTHLSQVDEAKLGIASSNMDRLGVNALTPDQRKELALNLVSKKRAEFVATQEKGIGRDVIRAAADGDETAIATLRSAAPEEAEVLLSKAADGKINEVMTALGERSKKFAESADIENPYVNYFPFIKKQNLDKFVQEIESKGIKVGSEGYKKQFKNLLTNETMEMDPAKAFFTREAQIATDNMNRDFLSGFAERYGKPLDAFASAEEAAQAGFKVLKEKGMFGKEIGYIAKHDHDLIRDALAPEFQTINMLAKATGFDAMTSLFKRSVTGLFLPFHVRNWVSGVVQNFETIGARALDPMIMNSGGKIALKIAQGEKSLGAGTIKLGGKERSMDKIYRAFKDRFGGATFYTNDFLKAMDMGKSLDSVAPVLSKERFMTTLKTGGLGQEAVHFKMARVVGQFLEHQQKATAYLGAMANGKSMKAALDIAEQAGFDYRALTRFESQIMRRAIPFYSFARKNAELQLKTIMNNPERINQVMAVIRNLGVPVDGEEMENLPEFMKESLISKIGMNADGLNQYIANFGTPIEGFAQLFDDNQLLRTISQFNPLIKVPIELGIGKDSFRQKDLKDVYDAREYSGAPQIVKDLLGLHPVEKTTYKKIGETSVPTGTYTQYVADPEKLLIARSLFTSRGVTYLDSLFNGDLNGFAKYLKLVTGVKPYAVNPDITKAQKEKELKRDLEDLLIRENKLKKYESVFKPKQ